jgi:hypothetical protein
MFHLRKTGILVFGPEDSQALKNVSKSLASNEIPHEKLTASEVCERVV